MHRPLALALTLALATSIPASAAPSAPARGGEAEVSLVLRAVPGTPFQDGDRLVARRLGLADWYRGGTLLATVGDPEGLVAPGRPVAALGLLLVDEAGRPVHRLSAEPRPLFLRSAPPVAVFSPRGHRKPGPDRSLLMAYHGGYVLNGTSTIAIFWGPEWSDPAFAGDVVGGIGTFLAGFGGSVYARTLDEYAVRPLTAPSVSTYRGSLFDPTPPPAAALSGPEVGMEVCKLTGNHPDGHTVYLVYTSPKLDDGDFCAFHTFVSCPVTGELAFVAYLPNVEGFRGCGISDGATGHSPLLAALANASAHELTETITDPLIDAWFQDRPDFQGEIADKCAYAFPRRPTRLANASYWKLQMLWSNAFFLSGRGLPNHDSQRGCK